MRNRLLARLTLLARRGPVPLLSLALLGACDRTPQVAVSTAAEGPPHVVVFDPPNGATDVDPDRTTLSVTFDRAMDPQGWAWVIEGPDTAPDLGEARFDSSSRTNTVDAKLQPGHAYVLWVNSEQYSHFRDRGGNPATPVRWVFATRQRSTASAGSPAADGIPAGWPIRPVPAHESAPRVIALDPPNGATHVDPAKTLLKATFDRDMEGSWAWVTEGNSFPEMAGNAYFEPDARTAALPVKLEPGRTYVVWLNSAQYPLFRDIEGHPADPLRWTFTTAPASP